MTPQLYRLQKQTLSFLGKHHTVIFITCLCLIMAFGIFQLYQVVQTTFSPPEATASTITGFDQKIIEKIKNLHDSSTSSSQVELPSPRSDPFSG